MASIEKFCHKFDDVTKKPETFLSAPEKLINNVKKLIKETYDFTKKEETLPVSNSLPNLIVDNFDVEQIWQQIELQNENILSEYLSSVSRLVACKEKLWFANNDESILEETNEDDEKEISDNDDLLETSDDDKSVEENDEQLDQNSDESEIEETEENDTEKENAKPKQNKNKSIVDDEFFKLDEMEQFLKNQENQPDKQSDDSDEESVDLFENNLNADADSDEDDSSSEMNLKYDDFFVESQPDNKKRKKIEKEESEDENSDQIENKKMKVHFEDELAEDKLEIEDENKNVKSTLEEREERLKRKIKELEDVAIEDKPWQLKGEVTADKRPQNSLLEEIVDFDLTVRPAPVITEETTMRLEDVIKQRIKDKVWDDVERKIKEVDTPFEYKKKLLLDQEKSKQSLAQIYEDEYLKQQEALNPNSAEKPEEEVKEHTEIKTMMKKLFSKLDALSNFHFTPKTVAPELRIISNLPAINMEEVAPVAATNASLLAPEEVKNKTKGNEVGKAERTDTDKKRERRQKKQKQRDHAKAKKQKEKLIEKLRPGLGNKYSKQKVTKLLEKVTKDRNVEKMNESTSTKSIKSSTAFFSQLQDEVKSHIKSNTKSQNKKSKQTFNAKKLKL